MANMRRAVVPSQGSFPDKRDQGFLFTGPREIKHASFWTTGDGNERKETACVKETSRLYIVYYVWHTLDYSSTTYHI